MCRKFSRFLAVAAFASILTLSGCSDGSSGGGSGDGDGNGDGNIEKTSFSGTTWLYESSETNSTRPVTPSGGGNDGGDDGNDGGDGGNNEPTPGPDTTSAESAVYIHFTTDNHYYFGLKKWNQVYNYKGAKVGDKTDITYKPYVYGSVEKTSEGKYYLPRQLYYYSENSIWFSKAYSSYTAPSEYGFYYEQKDERDVTITNSSKVLKAVRNYTDIKSGETEGYAATQTFTWNKETFNDDMTGSLINKTLYNNLCDTAWVDTSVTIGETSYYKFTKPENNEDYYINVAKGTCTTLIKDEAYYDDGVSDTVYNAAANDEKIGFVVSGFTYITFDDASNPTQLTCTDVLNVTKTYKKVTFFNKSDAEGWKTEIPAVKASDFTDVRYMVTSVPWYLQNASFAECEYDDDDNLTAGNTVLALDSKNGYTFKDWSAGSSSTDYPVNYIYKNFFAIEKSGNLIWYNFGISEKTSSISCISGDDSDYILIAVRSDYPGDDAFFDFRISTNSSVNEDILNWDTKKFSIHESSDPGAINPLVSVRKSMRVIDFISEVLTKTQAYWTVSTANHKTVYRQCKVTYNNNKEFLTTGLKTVDTSTTIEEMLDSLEGAASETEPWFIIVLDEADSTIQNGETEEKCTVTYKYSGDAIKFKASEAAEIGLKETVSDDGKTAEITGPYSKTVEEVCSMELTDENDSWTSYTISFVDSDGKDVSSKTLGEMSGKTVTVKAVSDAMTLTVTRSDADFTDSTVTSGMSNGVSWSYSSYTLSEDKRTLTVKKASGSVYGILGQFTGTLFSEGDNYVVMYDSGSLVSDLSTAAVKDLSETSLKIETVDTTKTYFESTTEPSKLTYLSSYGITDTFNLCWVKHTSDDDQNAGYIECKVSSQKTTGASGSFVWYEEGSGIVKGTFTYSGDVNFKSGSIVLNKTHTGSPSMGASGVSISWTADKKDNFVNAAIINKMTNISFPSK